MDCCSNYNYTQCFATNELVQYMQRSLLHLCELFKFALIMSIISAEVNTISTSDYTRPESSEHVNIIQFKLYSTIKQPANTIIAQTTKLHSKQMSYTTLCSFEHEPTQNPCASELLKLPAHHYHPLQADRSQDDLQA